MIPYKKILKRKLSLKKLSKIINWNIKNYFLKKKKKIK